MDSMERSPRALLLPLSTRGHWAPTLSLMRQLAAQKIDLTVWTTRDCAAELKSIVAEGEFGNTDVEVVVVFRDFSIGQKPSLLKNPSEDIKTYRDEFNPSVARFSFLIADMMYERPSQDLADEWGIPRYTFFTSPSYMALSWLHCSSLLEKGWLTSSQARRDGFVDLPGLEWFTATDLPEHVRKNPEYQLYTSTSLPKARGLIVNSFEEFERKSLEDLRCQLQLRAVTVGRVPPKVFSVGPLFMYPNLSSSTFGSSNGSDDTRNECIKWLDTKEQSSVLFICFGSLTSLPESLRLEVARALESIGVPFLWALRLPHHEGDMENIFPSGFESRTRDRGLVMTTWVPQQEVLLHPSTGGFLSHCGWNSIMESVYAGVPIVACPLYAEQGMNSRFMVDALKIAVPINRKGPVGEVDATEVATAIRSLMEEEHGKQVRQNMLKMKKAADAAVTDGGSSRHNLLELIGDIFEVEA